MSDSAPEATIVVRTAGRRPHGLARAVRSILDQQGAAPRVIVVGDGCDPASLLKGLADPRLSIEAGPKQGRSATGNAGAALAGAPLLGFLDDDDELLPQHVARLGAVLAAQPGAVAAYGLAEEIAVRGEHDAARDGRRRIRGSAPFSLPGLWFANYLPLQSVLFRKAALRGAAPFDAALDALEDWDLWLRLSQAGSFQAVPEVTSRYRVPAESKARRARAAQHAPARQALLRKHADFSVPMSFPAMQGLEDHLKARLDDFIGVRYSFSRLWRRLRQGE
jgi:glycosyltransferase involved in cell wall biosynthesis